MRPPRGQLQAFQRQPLQHVPAAPGPSQASQPFSVMNPRRGSVQAFSAAHAINSLRLGHTLANQANMNQAAEASLRFWCPEDWQRLG